MDGRRFLFQRVRVGWNVAPTLSQEHQLNIFKLVKSYIIIATKSDHDFAFKCAAIENQVGMLVYYRQHLELFDRFP